MPCELYFLNHTNVDYLLYFFSHCSEKTSSANGYLRLICRIYNLFSLAV
jgi:hypothetical protein